MSPVSQYVYDGRIWRNEAATSVVPPPAPVVVVDPLARAPIGPVTSNGVAWRQIFAEDFDASVKSVHWAPYPNGSGAGKYHEGNRVTYHDSLMDIEIKDVAGVMQGTAGIFGKPQMSMRSAMRFRTTSVFAGAGMASMMWPHSGRWSDGEIDWPEVQFNGYIRGYVHRVGANPEQNALVVNTTVTPSSGWHTAVTEWRPGHYVKFYLDDLLVGTCTSAVAVTAHDWRFQAADNGGANSAGGRLQVEWVAQWVLA